MKNLLLIHSLFLSFVTSSFGLDYQVQEKITENFKKLNGDETALAQIFCFLKKYQNSSFKVTALDKDQAPKKIVIRSENQNFVTINDLTKSFHEQRFYQINLNNGDVKVYYSSHGKGGREGVGANDEFADYFSDKDSTYATPRGIFLTGSKRNDSSDSRWDYSMYLHGLQNNINSNSNLRHVIIHPFPFVPKGFSDSSRDSSNNTINGPVILSHGCTMLAEEHAFEIIENLKSTSLEEGGSFYYNYTKYEKSKGQNYCIDNSLTEN